MTDHRQSYGHADGIFHGVVGCIILLVVALWGWSCITGCIVIKELNVLPVRGVSQAAAEYGETAAASAPATQRSNMARWRDYR